MADTARDRYLRRKAVLWTERSSWVSQWQEVSRFLLPRNGRFLVTERNLGDKRHNQIYDNTALRALRVLAAGLMAGMTSPARPWFRLETADKDLMEYGPVKLWANSVTEMMRIIFARSNTYRALHMMYEELGGFGTGANIVLPDYDNVTHDYPLTIGEYAIATNYRGMVDTVYREFQMTTGQMVDQFGLDKVSQSVRDLHDKGDRDKWRTVLHVIEPRTERDPKSRLAKDMPIASCYLEPGSDNGLGLLRESGFKRFPGIVPRWAATGGDIYGNGPGMEGLGHLKEIQHNQLRKAQGIDYKVKPPMQAPLTMKSNEVSWLPGGVSYVDGLHNSEMKPLVDPRSIDLKDLLASIADTREQINDTFYVPLFLMLANDNRSGITAREVAEKHEEKLLMLGPVLERLHHELLKPKIDITFDAMIEADLVPSPPPELRGQELNVEFVSMLAQAQRAIGTAAIDRYVMAIGQIAQFKPAVLDKFDEDEWADKYGEMLGVDPTLIVGNEKVAIVRQQRAEQQAAQQKMAQAQQMADTAQKLGNTPTGGGNALSDVISQFSGYGGPGMPAAA